MHHLAKSRWLDCELFNGQAIEAGRKHQKLKKVHVTLHDELRVKVQVEVQVEIQVQQKGSITE